MPNNRRQFFQKATLAVGASVFAPVLSWAGNGENKTIQKPKRLQPGDTIALMAPAGAVFNDESIQKASQAIEAMGFRVKLGKTLYKKDGYLAGDDAFRAKELQDFLTDKSVAGIVAIRGGWGCARLLPHLDFTMFAESPKILSGFSDMTTLLLAFYKQIGHVTFHGPVGNSTWEGFTTQQFLAIARDAQTPTLKCLPDAPHTTITKGTAEGILLGGNLTVLCNLLGTPFSPDYAGAILFLEETEEEPYRIDRLLTQLELSGQLARVKGIVFGKCTKCDPEEPEKSFSLSQVLEQKLKPLGVPVFTGAPFGHTKDKWTLPLGINARMDA
ncbi:MAG: S66 peptidase family protein, partial [Bacteroidia bacterium]